MIFPVSPQKFICPASVCFIISFLQLRQQSFSLRSSNICRHIRINNLVVYSADCCRNCHNPHFSCGNGIRHFIRYLFRHEDSITLYVIRMDNNRYANPCHVVRYCSALRHRLDCTQYVRCYAYPRSGVILIRADLFRNSRNKSLYFIK